MNDENQYLRFNCNGTKVVVKRDDYVVIEAYKKAILVEDFFYIAETVNLFQLRIGYESGDNV